MLTSIDTLTEAQQHAMAIRPQIGGFPVMAEVLRQAGVVRNEWSLPSCQSLYVMTSDAVVVQQGEPLIDGTEEVPAFREVDVVSALRTDQEGRSTFPEFLHSIWRAGVVSYSVDFVARQVTYVGALGQQYVEAYPTVSLTP